MEKKLICPLCSSENNETHLIRPAVIGGFNATDYYSCKECGIMFKQTEKNMVKRIEKTDTYEDKTGSAGAFN